MDSRQDLGTCRAMRIARAYVAFRVPEEWAAHIGLNLGDTVYMTGELDGAIEVHTEERLWSQPVRLRVKDRRYPILTIPIVLARTRGIDAGDTLSLSADAQSGSLWLRKEAG